MKNDLHKIETPQIDLDYTGINIQLVIDPVVADAIRKTNTDYLHWEQLKYKSWIPKQFSSKEKFWALIKMLRLANSSPTPIRDTKNQNFHMNIDSYAEILHQIDMEMGGNMMGIANFHKGDERKFIFRNIIEESIASSQLEGANTSRTVAKKMLLEGRKPRNHSEQMIINNYKAMKKIENEFCNQDLSMDLLLELHRILTVDTIPAEKQAVLRETIDEEGNELKILLEDKIIYYAPNKEFVEHELPKLIDFFNNNERDGYGFIHPLIKAILIHFWIGLLHPFEDGNGRLARTLFYWYMLRQGYWLFAYVSLSAKILKSRNQYAWSYVYSEQDHNDANYFIHYNIDKLKLAIQDFKDYIDKKIKENQEKEYLIKKNHAFNQRQVKLLKYLFENPKEHVTLISHQTAQVISKATAATDLKKLVKLSLLKENKNGRNVYYTPENKIKNLFEK